MVQVLVFIFSAVTFNYALALISNALSLGVSLRSMNRFGTNATAYLEAVKEIAGPTSLDSITRVQSAIDCMKIASSLEKVDTYLKVLTLPHGLLHSPPPPKLISHQWPHAQL